MVCPPQLLLLQKHTASVCPTVAERAMPQGYLCCHGPYSVEAGAILASLLSWHLGLEFYLPIWSYSTGAHCWNACPCQPVPAPHTQDLKMWQWSRSRSSSWPLHSSFPVQWRVRKTHRAALPIHFCAWWMWSGNSSVGWGGVGWAWLPSIVQEHKGIRHAQRVIIFSTSHCILRKKYKEEENPAPVTTNLSKGIEREPVPPNLFSLQRHKSFACEHCAIQHCFGGWWSGSGWHFWGKTQKTKQLYKGKKF